MKKIKCNIFGMNKMLTMKGMALHFGNQKRKTAYILWYYRNFAYSEQSAGWRI